MRMPLGIQSPQFWVAFVLLHRGYYAEAASLGLLAANIKLNANPFLRLFSLAVAFM